MMLLSYVCTVLALSTVPVSGRPSAWDDSRDDNNNNAPSRRRGSGVSPTIILTATGIAAAALLVDSADARSRRGATSRRLAIERQHFGGPALSPSQLALYPLAHASAADIQAFDEAKLKLQAMYLEAPRFGRCFAEGLAEMREEGLDPEAENDDQSVWYSDIMNAVLVACARKFRLPNPQLSAVMPSGKRVSVRKVASEIMPDERYFGSAGDKAGSRPGGRSIAEQLVDGARTGALGMARQNWHAFGVMAARRNGPAAPLRIVPH